LALATAQESCQLQTATPHPSFRLETIAAPVARHPPNAVDKRPEQRAAHHSPEPGAWQRTRTPRLRPAVLLAEVWLHRSGPASRGRYGCKYPANPADTATEQRWWMSRILRDRCRLSMG